MYVHAYIGMHICTLIRFYTKTRNEKVMDTPTEPQYILFCTQRMSQFVRNYELSCPGGILLLSIYITYGGISSQFCFSPSRVYFWLAFNCACIKHMYCLHMYAPHVYVFCLKYPSRLHLGTYSAKHNFSLFIRFSHK
jgi:hypothetical protein